MDLVNYIINLMLNLDIYLSYIINLFGIWTYLLLFVVVFSETGIIFLSFLPGDSLLFVIGALSANGEINFFFSIILLTLAAILGDTINYSIGKYVGPKIFNKENSIFFNKNHLIEAHDFYEKYGGKTIILGRFIPVIRAFAPFIAGIGKMPYKKFLSFNIIGGFLWVMLIVSIGYLFGNIPIIKNNLSIIIIIIVAISILPIIVKNLLKRFNKR